MTFTTENNSHAPTVELNETELDIKRHLSDATPSQIVEIANLIDVHHHLQSFSADYPQDLEPFQEVLRRIQKNLDYKKPFRVALAATSGIGKSTLLNALIARPLVLVKDYGAAGTGCALEIFQDTIDNKSETALVEYRTEADIRRLINEQLVSRYQIDTAYLSGALNESFAAILLELEPQATLLNDERQEFNELCSMLADVVKQYARNPQEELQTKFDLTNTSHTDDLMELTNEESLRNKSVRRAIGLVKRVQYHICPDPSQELHLPNNVCLVDLPGLNGTRLHNIIIQEGIQEADAVLFVVRPTRFKDLTNRELLHQIRQYIGADHDPRAAERLFLVVNAKDDLKTDPQLASRSIEREFDQLMEELIPNSRQYSRYFLISAWGALQAQQALQGKAVDHDDYDRVKLGLRIRDGSDRQILEASNVPFLVRELSTFVKSRIDLQIRESQQQLSSILSTLVSSLTQEIEEPEHEDQHQKSREKFNRALEARRFDVKNMIKEFRRNQISQMSAIKQNLHQVAIGLCNEIDKSLQAEMPVIWKENFSYADYSPQALTFVRITKEEFLGKVEVKLWEQIAAKVQTLADELVRFYRHALGVTELPVRVSSQCFDYVDCDAITVKLEQGVQAMEKTLVPSVKGFSLMYLVNPSNGFITLSEDGKTQESLLMQCLKRMALNPEVRDVAFDEFVLVMRKHYQDFIYQACIDGLLNLYRYEMLRCEMRLITYLNNRFDEMSRSTDLSFQEYVCGNGNDSELQQSQQLEQKLNRLKPLKQKLDGDRYSTQQGQSQQ
jgi:hypothetical protein